MSEGANENLLTIRDLSVSFGARPVLHGVSMDISRGETVGVVGESGSGKSLTALAIMGLLPAGASLHAGTMRLTLQGREESLERLNTQARRSLRGRHIAMIFQEPMTSLNPVFSIGEQVMESLRVHRGSSGRAAKTEAASLLARVGIADSAGRLDAYPHEFSGGMRQRVMIAMALAGNPSLLLADEPTTALDVTVQARVLDLLDELRAERKLGVMLISHDLGLVAQRAQRVFVMLQGRVVESAPAPVVMNSPGHPYTRALLASAPRLGARRERLATVSQAATSDRVIEQNAGLRAWWPGDPGMGTLQEIAPGHEVMVASNPQAQAERP